MIHTLPCPRCGAYLDISDEMFQGPVQCEGCQAVFTPDRETILQPLPPPSRVRRPLVETRRDEPRQDKAVADDDADEVSTGLEPGSGWAISSLVLGLLSLLLGSALWFVCCPIPQTILGVIAIFLGYRGLRTEGRVMAFIGLILGLIAAFTSLIVMIFLGAMFKALSTVGTAPVGPPGAATVTTFSGSMNPTPPKFPQKNK